MKIRFSPRSDRTIAVQRNDAKYHSRHFAPQQTVPEVNVLGSFAHPIAHLKAADGNRAGAGYDLAPWQVPVAHQSRPAVFGSFVGMADQQACNLGLDIAANVSLFQKQFSGDTNRHIDAFRFREAHS